MSRGFDKNRTEIIEKLERELRQVNGLGASFFRMAAARLDMTITDMQVIDILDSTGLATAGQLAEQTGLTTGAITGMINRLEEAGLVKRERDPNDGRRVIVRLDKDKLGQISSAFDSMSKAWGEMLARYDGEQLAFLLDFLKNSNMVARQEIARLQEPAQTDGRNSSAPLSNVKQGRLVVASSLTRLVLRTDDETDQLYQARFEGHMPEVKVKDGVVTLRYPRRFVLLGGDKQSAEIWLNPAIPWEIVLQGGAAEMTGHLGQLKLAGLEVKGAMSTIRLELPEAMNRVPIRIGGSASEIKVHRPAGVAARVHLKGWASEFVFDDQTYSALGSDVRLQSRHFDLAAPHYDIEVASSVSAVSITAG